MNNPIFGKWLKNKRDRFYRYYFLMQISHYLYIYTYKIGVHEFHMTRWLKKPKLDDYSAYEDVLELDEIKEYPDPKKFLGEIIKVIFEGFPDQSIEIDFTL